MANGFFLGGAAEGALASQKQALAEQTLAQDTALRSRGVDLQERTLERTLGQDAQREADTRIAETMEIASQTIKEGLAGGTSPDKLKATVAPLVQSAQSIAQRIGRDPASLTAQIDAQLAAPGPIATAGVKGKATAAQRIAEAHGIAAATGTGVDVNPYEKPEKRVELENTLRDDYTKASGEFVIQRDFMDRIKSAPATGAGDMALVFSYMKVLDPRSTVREGEYATAQNAAGVPSAIQAVWNKVVGGGQLDAQARKQIKEAAGKVWSGALSRQSALTTQYSNIAKRQGLRRDNVIVDFTAGSEGPTAPITGTTDTGIKWNWKGTGP